MAAIYKEYMQLKVMISTRSLDTDSLPRSQNKGALRTINLIKEKWSGKLKGRTCADGLP